VYEPSEPADGERGTRCRTLLQSQPHDAIEPGGQFGIEPDGDGRGGNERIHGQEARRGGGRRRRDHGTGAGGGEHGEQRETGESHEVRHE
jgi:hypothetical protein